MIAAAVLVAGGGIPTPSAVSDSAGDEPRVNSGGFDPGFDPLTCGPKRLVS